MLVDCDTCAVRGLSCGDCVVSVLLGAPPSGVELDETERRALTVLAEAGMVPQLRLVPVDRSVGHHTATEGRRRRRAG
jgi:hypothetical protein